MTAGVEIKGLKELQRSLKTLDKDLGKVPQKVDKKAAELVAATARGKAPRKTGRLAASIKPGSSGTTAYVRSVLIYAPIQEFGGYHHIKGKHYLSRALEQDMPKIVALYEVELNTAVAKVHGI